MNLVKLCIILLAEIDYFFYQFTVKFAKFFIVLITSYFLAVKSPFSVDNIVKNATKSSRQGAIACITDDHCVITFKDMIYWKNKIMEDGNYTKDEVHFIIDGVLYKHKRPR